MIRRFARRLRFGERVIRAADVRPDDRVLLEYGLHRITRVQCAAGDVIVLTDFVGSWHRFHASAPVLVHRERLPTRWDGLPLAGGPLPTYDDQYWNRPLFDRMAWCTLRRSPPRGVAFGPDGRRFGMHFQEGL